MFVRLPGFMQEIAITDPVQDKLLQFWHRELANDPDPTLSEADFSWSPTPAWMLREVVVQSYIATNRFKYPKTQPEGLRRLLDFWPRLKAANREIKDMTNSCKTEGGKTTCQLPYDQWQLLYDRDRYTKYAQEFLEIGYLLSGEAQIPDSIKDKALSALGPRQIGANFYLNACALPKELGDMLRTVEGRLFEDAISELQIKRLELKIDTGECRGNGCLLSNKENSFLHIPNLILNWRSNVGVEAIDPINWSRGSCFSGAMLLMGVNQNPLPFDKYETMPYGGRAVVGSHDECEGFPGPPLYQSPSSLVVHNQVRSALLTVQIADQAGKTVGLEVTPDHGLLADKGGQSVWMSAGELRPGDLLRDGLGMTLHRVVNISRREGTFTLYNLHFPVTAHPNYLVSPDGKTWVIAHNLQK